jgi:hypothetical protein
VADDLVAAPGQINRVKLQRAEPFNQRENRSAACWKLSRWKKHMALGEEAAGRRPRDAQGRVAWNHLSVTRPRVRSRDCVP